MCENGQGTCTLTGAGWRPTSSEAHRCVHTIAVHIDCVADCAVGQCALRSQIGTFHYRAFGLSVVGGLVEGLAKGLVVDLVEGPLCVQFQHASATMNN